MKQTAEADAKLHRNNSCDIQSTERAGFSPRCDLKPPLYCQETSFHVGDNAAISYLSRAVRRWICLEAISPKGALIFRRVYHPCVIFFFLSLNACRRLGLNPPTLVRH